MSGQTNMVFEVKGAKIAVNMPDLTALRAEIGARLHARRGFALATINLDHLVKLRKDADFRAAYVAQDLVVADGNPIVWLSKLAGRPVGLIPGSDIVVPLAQMAAAQDVPIALLGSSEHALERAANALMAQCPGLRVAAQIAPPMGFDPDSAAATKILQEVAASGAGICFLALGAPKQERLAALGRKIAPELGFVSIGAGLDFLAGTQTRAPVWVRRLALEWLWRMLGNPRRMLGRYAQCAAILPHELRQAHRLRLHPTPEVSS